jgi:predicted amino acid racemase
MAFITLDAEKLKHNYDFLDAMFSKEDIHWAAVTKLLCGHQNFLEQLITMGVRQVCDSRVSNLRVIKQLNPDVETIYIKPPAKRALKSVVQFADISMNTSLETIRLLDQEAERQDKVHKVIIMIEMGELREGVMREDLMEFYERIFELPNIEVVGIGTNLSCLYGVLPNHDKLIQLSLYEQLIEAKFNKHIPLVSGGSSVTIPLMLQGILPAGINHFRVGESLFLGTNPYDNGPIDGLHVDVFRLYAEIIELIEKPMIPMGEMGQNVEGESFEFDEGDAGKTAFRAIIDLGLLDVESSHIKPVDENITIAGASSDMLVIDLGDNPEKYEVGQLLEFELDYMGTLRVLNSRYIEKRIENPISVTPEKEVQVR